MDSATRHSQGNRLPFFPGRGTFHALIQSILPALAELALKKGEKTLRVWSAGCASGEEPYSMSLLWSFALRTDGQR
ncbi:chemotaxis protein methyltransferase CheR [Nitrosospira multiformis]|uniref:Chemotaxis protein methyltransferase CheR n=1 Tax=Nitrosospira multiformis TaxID=1231 RepID=A0A1H8EV61_9PROT|nr:chemotaxis protein methyltransferase CheR [Nitrosospira multiformis]